MDRQITIEQRAVTRGSNGEQVETWATLRRAWASYRADRHNEDQLADAQIVQVRATFRMHYCSDLVEGTHRINYNNRTWDIVAVIEVGRRTWTDVVAVARVP